MDVLAETGESLRGELEASRQEVASLVREHRRDREVLHEKIQRSEENERDAVEARDTLSGRVAVLDAEVSSLAGQLVEERAAGARLAKERRELRNSFETASATKEQVVSQLEQERATARREIDALETRASGLEARLRAVSEGKGVAESSVVGLTTEVESIRRTLTRAVDDICTRYGTECRPVQDFLRNRGRGGLSPSRSRSPSPSRRSAGSPSSSRVAQTPGRSVVAPQVEGIRGAVREMSTLLHALAAGSLSMQQMEERELLHVRQRVSDTESELRRAQDTVNAARAQHAGALRSAQADLAAERERSRQLDALVNQLRQSNSRSGATNEELMAAVADLEGQVVAYKTEIASLRAQLAQAAQESERLARAGDDALDSGRREAQTSARLRSELDAARSEMEQLEQTVSSELAQLADQHAESVASLQRERTRAESAESDLRLCRASLEDSDAATADLRREVARQQEDFAQRMQERMGSAQVELQALKNRLADVTAQAESDRARAESEAQSLRNELGTSEATAGMLREQVRFVF